MDNCAQYLDLISARLDGELSVQEEEQLQAHLAQCPMCRTLLADLTAIHLETSHPTANVPEGFSQRVMQRIQAEAFTKAQQKKRRRHYQTVAGMAATVALVVWAAGSMDFFHSAEDAAATASVSFSSVERAADAGAALTTADTISDIQENGSAKASTYDGSTNTTASYDLHAQAQSQPVPSPTVIPPTPADAFTLTGDVPPELAGYPTYAWEDGLLAIQVPAEEFASLADALYALGMTGEQDTTGLDTVWVYVIPAE